MLLWRVDQLQAAVGRAWSGLLSHSHSHPRTMLVFGFRSTRNLVPKHHQRQHARGGVKELAGKYTSNSEFNYVRLLYTWPCLALKIPSQHFFASSPSRHISTSVRRSTHSNRLERKVQVETRCQSSTVTMAILDILNKPAFDSRFKLPVHIIQAILITIVIGLSVPRLFMKNKPRTRASTIALGMVG